MHEELTLAHRRGTQDTHRTGAGRTHRGSTAVGAQRGAAMHLPEKIGWQSSGAQLYPRPCRASLGRDSSSVQPPRTNPALASVSGASRRSRAAPGRRSLIIAAIASAAMAIAVTPPLGTVLVAHAELAGTASPSASPLLQSQSASHPAAAMVAAERKKKSTPPALAGEAPASQLKSYSQPLPQRMGTTERATKCIWPTSAANSSNIAIHQMRTRHGGTRGSAQNERRTRAHDGDSIIEHAQNNHRTKPARPCRKRVTCAEAAEAGAPEPVLIGCGPGALARRGKGSQRLQWAEVPWRRTRGHYDARALTPGHPRSSVLMSERRTVLLRTRRELHITWKRGGGA